ncbi:hypothetical protein KC19_6G007600 [Ceratodon purpureus]|uniref:Uncharacterized protein n=1 Tax=Ceratodon purpureus TaxID=3225 RepID=A0A8T0H8K0_CERPU|nr:hypothetical protein KC19_6G007600 [Ceratodon purpureus]
MAFISDLPDDVVVRTLLPKLRVPFNRRRECDCDMAKLKEILTRLRCCWALSLRWKTAIEETVEWAAWRLARWEADEYHVESSGPDQIILHIDARHPLYGKSDALENFRTNFNAFARSKPIWVHCKRHDKLTPRELDAPMHTLTISELRRIRDVLTKSMIAINRASTGQTWVTPMDRLD